MHIDYSLYLIIDDSICPPNKMCELLDKIKHAGITCVQLRMKGADTFSIETIGRKLLAILKPLHIPLIINDHINVAININADGVHIGQNDMCHLTARNQLGSDKILGLTIENLAQAKLFQHADIDYFGVGPVFTTTTKLDAPPSLGVTKLKNIVDVLTKPVIGIGGINSSNLSDVLNAGVDGVAVISAILGAIHPEHATMNLSHLITTFRET